MELKREVGDGIGLGPADLTPIRGGGGAAGNNGALKRKRSGPDLDISPSSEAEHDNDHDHDHDDDRRRQPGVKRACNECRQQKLRCDVVQDPFSSCSRCNRLKLDCKIESNFKRVGKRSRHAEMEKQIEKLKSSLARAVAQGYAVEEEEDLESTRSNGLYKSQYQGSDDAVSSLLHLKQGYGIRPQISKQLEDVGLTEDAINLLFTEYFGYFHPFLPILNPMQLPEVFFTQSPLLFWTVISIAARRTKVIDGLIHSITGPLHRLLWTTIGSVPGSHHVVKALCLLCTWPLPTSTTSTDPTHILGGVMMKTATGIGLHRPSHAQDFSRVSVELNQDELHDRVLTWAVCNIVSQSIGTGYGQPASTLYDWTLAVRPGDQGPFGLSPELEARLQIERFTDKISKEMYSNATDPQGVSGDEVRAMLTRVFKREYNDLTVSVMSRNDLSPLIEVFLKAAGLHLRLAAFFDSSTTPSYMDDLMGLWRATSQFLDAIFLLDTPSETRNGHILLYGTNYLMQMVVAAGFSLLKLLSSFFASEIDFEKGRQLFHKTIATIRSMSIISNDLACKLAELMVQMWNGVRVESRQSVSSAEGQTFDGSLQLKVRCRHSMSLVFDSIWRWREDYQAHGRSLEGAQKNPTKPDSATDSRASSTALDNTIMSNNNMHMQNQYQQNLAHHALSGDVTPAQVNSGNIYNEANYQEFDPLNWMLDGLVDFPYSYGAVQGLEAQRLS